MSKLIQKRLKQIEIIEQKTPEQIAEIMGVSRATYFNIKNGTSLLNTDQINVLIDRFGYSGEWFFNNNIK